MIYCIMKKKNNFDCGMIFFLEPRNSLAGRKLNKLERIVKTVYTSVCILEKE